MFEQMFLTRPVASEQDKQRESGLAIIGNVLYHSVHSLDIIMRREAQFSSMIHDSPAGLTHPETKVN